LIRAHLKKHYTAAGGKKKRQFRADHFLFGFFVNQRRHGNITA
jgi:hypothetical protein